MPRKIRVLVPTGEAHLVALVPHLRQLLAAGHTIVYLTADRPYRTLVETYQKEGLDVSRFFFLDVVSFMDGRQPPERQPNATFLQSPTMLEMMAMRVEQLASRHPDKAHVVVDSLNTLALYNGGPPVQEFSHYLANRMRAIGVSGDFIIRDNKEGQALAERVASFTDEQVGLVAP